jgi:transmembrane sensor
VPSRPAATTKPETTPDWKALVAKGDHQAAFDALGIDGIQREADVAKTVDELVDLADVARLSGHAKAAVGPLRRAAAMGGNGAAVAGYTLGRLLLDQLGDPAGAAGAFEAAIERGLPRSLDEPAHARVVEAHARAGHGDAAARWAAVYEQSYPDGKSLETVKRWADR